MMSQSRRGGCNISFLHDFHLVAVYRPCNDLSLSRKINGRVVTAAKLDIHAIRQIKACFYACLSVLYLVNVYEVHVLFLEVLDGLLVAILRRDVQLSADMIVLRAEKGIN